MKENPILAGLLAAWLTIAPVPAVASGANLLVPATISGALQGQPSPAPPASAPPATFRQIITQTGCSAGTIGVGGCNAIGQAQATFASRPTTGDWLIAVQTYVTSASPAAGWTDVYAGAACGSYGVALTIAYHQVTAGDGATYTPFSANSGSLWAITIADVGTGLGSWAAVEYGIVANCVGSNAANTVSTSFIGANSTVLAVGVPNVATSGGMAGVPTIGGVIGNTQAAYSAGCSGACIGVVGAYGVVAGYYGSATATITPNMSGGFAGNNAIMIGLNPG